MVRWSTSRIALTTIILGLIIGALLNFLVAQAAGWWSKPRSPTEFHWPRAGSDAPEVASRSGIGKQVLTWRTLQPWEAAIWQKIRASSKDKAGDAPDYDPPSSVPGWSSVWIESERTRQRTFTGNPNEPNPDATDIAVGWPVLSFAATVEPRILGANPANDPAPRAHGGFMPLPNLRDPGRYRLLAWTPVFPGVVFGSVFWGAVVAIPICTYWQIRRWRRMRSGRCSRCGYDMRGLVAHSPCPECGTPINSSSPPPDPSRSTHP